MPGPLCFFSKHLPDLAPGPLARALRTAGFDGVELTVRPGGHVLPERVEIDLPAAVAAIRDEGLEVPVIATALTAGDPTAILATAGALGIPLFRPGWLTYEDRPILDEVRRASDTLAALADLGRRAGVALAYQNHVGRLGAAVWDLEHALAPLDPRWAGVYYDVRHAVAEGSGGSWRQAAALVAPRVKVLGVKDFFWERGVARSCPLGEGVVDLPAALAILGSFSGPVTLFFEYQPSDMLAAAARDLAHLKTVKSGAGHPPRQA
jgi:sugar phosphate isomerase/epimerase